MCISDMTKDSDSATPRSPVVKVEGLRKVYKSRRQGETVAVDDVSFEVGRGEIVGLLGPNGAGKTTTIKSICTLVTPTAGAIHINGVDVSTTPRAAVANIAAVLEGNRNLYWRLTVAENLELFAGLHGIAAKQVRPLIAELIEQFDLSHKTKAEARTLSRGMQQKLAVACALVKETPLLLLDEPTLGLDVETSLELRQTLRTLAATGERTILLSSHDMDVVQSTCKRVIIINKGRIVTDDNVANLLELFRIRSYRFTLSGVLGEGALALLRREFPHMRSEADAQQTIVEAELIKAEQIYDFVDGLRRSGALIESIDRQDPNLEDIFLRVVKGESLV